MRILITGGAGFIGSYTAELLLKRGHEVVVVDNMITGRHKNLENILGNIKLVEGDILDDDVVSSAIRGVDVVIHAASLTNVPESAKKADLYRMINSTGTHIMLQHSFSNGVKKFVFISTCAVYGDPLKVPIAEDAPTLPLSVYAETKLDAEGECEKYSNERGMVVAILRLFNVYGPRQTLNQYSGVITQFMDRVHKAKVPIIFGDGEQTRDFVFVEDAAKAIVAAAENKAMGTFNVGTGKATSIKELAETMIRLTGMNNLIPAFEKPRENDVTRSVADIEQMRKAFGFVPETPLEEGLRRTLGELGI
jgi:UDP-glucose 4-epimerase